MNLLLNASNVRHGGGVTVCLNLIREFLPLRSADRVYLIHPQGVGYEALGTFGNVTLLPVPDSFHHSYISKIRHNEYIFRAWCRQYSIDKVVSLGNVAFRCDGRPQLLYVQNAFLVYPDSPAWKRLSWRNFLYNSLMDQWASLHLRQATSFAVQTEVMKERLIKRFEAEDGKIYLVPNAADSHSEPAPARLPDGSLKLIFLSHYYPHKNFESLLPLARMIAEKRLPVSITLTLNRSKNPAVKELLNDIKKEGLENILPNGGHIPLAQIGAAMAAHDGLFLPTLLETFSGAYAEALRCGRPIFTSHYDFAVHSLGDAAFFFDPLNTDAIYRVLEAAVAKPEEMATKAKAAAALGLAMPDWPQIAQHFSDVTDRFV